MAVIKFNKRSHRLISSAYPPIGIFDEFGDADDAIAAMELESLTNDRLSGALGRVDFIPREDWTVGEVGSNVVMAAFLHPSISGGRFNNEMLGAWYASLSVETAIHETLYHNYRRLKASEAGFPNKMQMREYVSTPNANLEDITTEQANRPDLYHATDYTAGQRFGEDLRASNCDGIIYNSVRHDGGTNIVVFRPRLLVPVTQSDHYEYVWDASGNHEVKKITNVKLS